MVCKTAEDCPQSYLGDKQDCLNGLCGNPKKPLDDSDVLMLCLAGTVPGPDTPESNERWNIARSWKPSDPVPAKCRQP
jgi:hypothetical protein